MRGGEKRERERVGTRRRWRKEREDEGEKDEVGRRQDIERGRM